MAYRTCEDCVYNNGYECILRHNRIYNRWYDHNKCDDGTGAIYLEDDDNYFDDDEDE